MSDTDPYLTPIHIEGDNSAIKSLCKGLGATLVFDEKSHVHVEFKNGLSR